MGVPEGRILVVFAAGGEPRVVVEEPKGDGQTVRGWWQPRPLPGGRSVLVTRFEATGGTFLNAVETVDLATGARKQVLENAQSAEYLATGHLLAVREQAIVALPFDVSRQEATGGVVSVLSKVGDVGMGPPFFTSSSGVLAKVARSTEDARRRLAWIDAQGGAEPIEGALGPISWMSVSCSGRRVAYEYSDPADSEPATEFWVQDLERRTTTPLTSPGISTSVIWHPDEARVAYGASIIAGTAGIWERRTAGTEEPVLLYASKEPREMLLPLRWTSDGRILAFARYTLKSRADQLDVWMLEPGEGGAEGKATPYLSTRALEQEIAFSPDGRWLCYGSNESGSQELHVQRFTGPGSGAADAQAGRWRISANGGTAPWWSKDGKEIRYFDREERVMSVEVRTEPSFSASVPEVACTLKDLKLSGAPAFTEEGRMLAVLKGEGGETTQIDVVLGFFEELKAQVPASER